MGNKYCYYQLRLAQEQKMLASLYTDPQDPDSFIAGYIEAVTPRHALLWAVTPWGQADGWLLRRMDEVFQVFMGDDYEIRLQMLLQSQNQVYSPLLPQSVGENEDLLCVTLHHALQEGALVSVQNAEDTFTGTVAEVNDLYLTLDTLDFFGAPEGSRRFALREVQLLSIGTQEEKMYQRLRDERLKLL